MCTVIAKEGQNRVTILTGVPCCLSVEEVASQIPKVTRENGWFEMFVGEACIDVPKWATWLESAAQEKALRDVPETCRGKRVWFQDVSGRYEESR